MKKILEPQVPFPVDAESDNLCLPMFQGFRLAGSL